MIPRGHVHSFMRDRSSIWRRVTVAAGTGPRGAIITDNCGRLTPRGFLLSMLYAEYISWHWCSGHERTGAIRCSLREREEEKSEDQRSTGPLTGRVYGQFDKSLLLEREPPLRIKDRLDRLLSQVVFKWFWEGEERGWALEGIFFFYFSNLKGYLDLYELCRRWDSKYKENNNSLFS